MNRIPKDKSPGREFRNKDIGFETRVMSQNLEREGREKTRNLTDNRL